MPRLALLALLLASPLLAADLPTWKAGFAAVVITPPKPMWMSGYAARTKPAEGTELDLFAKAALLEDADGQKLLLVSLDLVGLDRDTSLGIRAGITKMFGIPAERIVLACSHTHCGPVVGKNLRSMYLLDAEQNKLVDDYTAALPGLIEKAVGQAAKNLEPVSLNAGQGTCTFAVNRRENKEAEVTPEKLKAGALKGPVDHDVPVLVAADKAGKVKGIVFGYACHATTLSYQKWSGDYPGYAMKAVEKANPGAVAVFWAGCGADQNPIPRRTQELAEKYGGQLADAVAAVSKQQLAAVKPTSAAVYQEIDLPLHELPTRDQLAKESQDANKYIAARAKMLLDKLKSGDLPKAYPYPVQAWRLGHQTWLHLGGEVVVDYAVRFKKESRGAWVTAYANDVMAYIPSARVLREGGYEGGGAMVYYGLPSVWGKEVEELIAAEVGRQVKAVAGK